MTEPLAQPFDNRSDVDVALESLAPEHFFRAMGALSETVGRDVDLVELHKCPFAARIRQGGLLWTRTQEHPSSLNHFLRHA
ncbi:MAG: hypothetical protein HC929_23835 [Leptolyngbyaceae cyanobacterium SM2_5_2]|nr:hypothetical protein [Leptolyngbyaceae cyanobacterium SM2_5_2]